jgi:hypothetical protein
MPKILINEKDRTTPGTSTDYANYSVLITGFAGRTPVTEADVEAAKKVDPTTKLVADRIQPDSNGVYEFSSKDDFEQTIGFVRPKLTVQKFVQDEDVLTVDAEWVGYHYGNQMAYELLNLGYSIIYKPIAAVTFSKEKDSANKERWLVDSINGKELLTKNDVQNNNDRFEEFLAAVRAVYKEAYWEIFKDKASYDFRFIVHGFLESSKTDAAKETRLAEVNSAYNALKAIEAEAKKRFNEQGTDSALEEVYWKETLFEGDEELEIVGIRDKVAYPGLVVDNNLYSDFASALAGTEAEKDVLEATLAVAGITTADINIANGVIADLAKYKVLDDNDMAIRELPGRGDCIALIELDESTYVNTTSSERPERLIIKAIRDMSTVSGDPDKGSFCAMTVPSIVYNMTVPGDNKDGSNKYDNNKKFPGSFHYLACFMNSLKSGFAEWYAAAGYTRGVSGYTVDYTTVKLGEIAINALEPRNIASENDPTFACNVIANFRGSYYLWGNRTAHPLGDSKSADKGDLVASHFLNIRQLCTTIKKQLYIACRSFTFNPNSDALWFNFVNAIRPTLEAMKVDQGIRDYRIMKVYTATKATLKAKIRIIPIEAVEDFDLEVSLEDSFGETTATVTE